MLYNFDSDLERWVLYYLRASSEEMFDSFWKIHYASERVKEIYARLDDGCQTFVLSCFSTSSIREPQSIPKLCNMSHLTSWLQSYKAAYPRCLDGAAAFEGMRLIDCQTQKVCKAGSSSRLIALSMSGPQRALRSVIHFPECF